MATPLSLQTDVRLRTLIWRGLKRRCPQCGKGKLFRRFMRLHANCDHCHLVYQKDPGSTWALWVLGDRMFLFAMIVPIYLGISIDSPWLRATFFAVVVSALVATMPHRQGVAVALDYLSRVKWDPDEPAKKEDPPPC